MSKRKQSRQQRRYNRTGNKIMDAARSVFAEKGLSAATVDDITERADIGRGSFYYHFANKEELIREIIGEILGELTEQMETRSKQLKDLGPMLDAMINTHIDFFSSRWEDFVLYYQGRADLTLEYTFEGLETPFMDYLGSIENLVDCAVPQPISKPKLRRLACAIAGFIAGYYSFASIATANEDIDKSFMSLRHAFVASLSRFVKEALPEDRVRW
jgi:AcrR family transcriptional regulator